MLWDVWRPRFDMQGHRSQFFSVLRPLCAHAPPFQLLWPLAQPRPTEALCPQGTATPESREIPEQGAEVPVDAYGLFLHAWQSAVHAVRAAGTSMCLQLAAATCSLYMPVRGPPSRLLLAPAQTHSKYYQAQSHFPGHARLCPSSPSSFPVPSPSTITPRFAGSADLCWSEEG